MTWSAKQYLGFEDERTRPVRDLLSALPDIEARAVIDLGCGLGNSTQVLAARFPHAVVSGLDSSPDMIAAARRRLPQARFAINGIDEWRDEGPFDVILANASLSRTAIASANWYYELLRGDCRKVETWRTTYYHALAGGASAIVEWFKGSGLRPFLEPLEPVWRAAYLERYTAAVARAYPALADGSVLLPFPRLFLVAIR